MRANPNFELNPHNLRAVLSICRLVEGMPLAIEWAAAWVAVLEPAQILSEIRSGLDFLESDAINIPGRHRSLPVVLDTFWQLLSEAERENVKKLSIFRGGFTSKAASEITKASPKSLLGLKRKSWLQRKTNGRYHMLELLRQHAEEKLIEDVELDQKIRTKHSQYYCRWLTAPETNLLGNGHLGYCS